MNTNAPHQTRSIRKVLASLSTVKVNTMRRFKDTRITAESFEVIREAKTLLELAGYTVARAAVQTPDGWSIYAS